jgi:hypothetical protein
VFHGENQNEGIQFYFRHSRFQQVTRIFRSRYLRARDPS